MARWELGARRRLVDAALLLFAVQGYDRTTTTQIAARAGVTKSTLFRHFASKRDILIAGERELLAEVVARIRSAPVGVAPAAALTRALADGLASRRADSSDAPTPSDALHCDAVLRARDPLRGVGLSAAMAAALSSRGADEAVAVLLGEIGAVSLQTGLVRAGGTDEGRLRAATLTALSELLEAGAIVFSSGAAGAAPAVT